MIPNTKLRQVNSSGVEASSSFGISSKDSVQLMILLRDALYTDKVLAVLREYSANAWDAHRSVGKGDVPIKITIPTSMNPTLLIRDFGPGLSQEEVFTVYTQYGASTKRNDDGTVGMFGIGSKSAFGYSDSFAITSWHGGLKKSYVAVIEESEYGRIDLLDTVECDPAETGIEIQVAVRPNDVFEFTNKAKKLYQYFVPRPEINVDLPPEPDTKTVLKNGTLFSTMEEGYNHRDGEWTAIMGCIPYKIDLDQLTAENNNGRGLAPYLNNTSGVLYFDIGAVQISGSREELKYGESTKKALVDKFELVVDEYVHHTLTAISSSSTTPWEKMCRANVLRSLKLPIPGKFKSLVSEDIDIKKAFPKSFTIKQDQQVVKSIAIARQSCLVLRDDDREMKGYTLSAHYYVVHPTPDTPLSRVEADLLDYMKAIGIEGMPIKRISTFHWYVEPKKEKTNNIKHKLFLFELIPAGGHFWRPFSQHWTPIERIPSKDDVFIIIKNFKGNHYDFFGEYEEDTRLATAFKKEMPKIFGYKTTEKKPINVFDCEGTEYRVWRKAFFESLRTAKLDRLLEFVAWSELSNLDEASGKARLERMKAALGARHPLVKIVRKHRDGRRAVGKLVKTKEMQQVLAVLKTRVGNYNERRAAPEAELKAVLKKYPLINSLNQIYWSREEKHWYQYIKLMDAHLEEKP